ncbi:hypothetical protein [Bacillus sp. Marseille-Q3570]|uniref:hypothetical protein n=1 Tax=Bacillus sp. Marseille-Q3570 TaxID=2963522 RepID=UPI0021B747AF|nr:hypothetical protein [Bacillus sp. Marseille-Q3570]
MLLRLQESPCRSELPRRMPCEEIIQVVGTLTTQDKESFGSITSHEEHAIFIFEESRTLLSNQLAQGDFFKMTQKQQSFRKEPF